MIERTKKQNVPEPAARPSTPSVMLTAFDAPTMTSTAKMTQPTFPMLMPMASERVNERAVEVCAHCTARMAKTSAHTNCATDFARLFSPRLRRWWTLM